jgi:hypothetical protein
MISLFFFVLAAICNSIMDTADQHFNTSIFSNFTNPKVRLWFNESQGWLNKYVDRDMAKGRVKWFWGINKPVQLTDSWHWFKMCMIIFCALSALFYHSISATYIINYFPCQNFLLDLLLFGIAWNGPFNLFYNTLLIKHK